MEFVEGFSSVPKKGVDILLIRIDYFFNGLSGDTLACIV